MKKFLLIAVVTLATIPEANAGPLRNLIRHIVSRPQCTQVTSAPQVATNTYVAYVASVAGCANGTCSLPR